MNVTYFAATLKDIDNRNLTVDTSYCIYTQEEMGLDSQKLNTIDRELERIVEEMKLDELASDYEKGKAIHSYIAEHLTYNKKASEALESDMSYRAAHSLAGALLGDEMITRGNVVCEGYAKMFKALCDKVDIPCVIVAGDAGLQGQMDTHMWNDVQVDGNLSAYDPADLGEMRFSYPTLSKEDDLVKKSIEIK